MNNNILNSKSLVLIYDSQCIFCCNFVKCLDLISDKIFVYSNPLLIIDPSKISILKDNYDFIISLERIEKLKNLSKRTIILIDNNNILIRTKALIRLSVFLRPNSRILKLINNNLSFLIAIFFDPIYILFSKYRYMISKILRNIFPRTFSSLDSSCLTSSDSIKFI